MVLGSSRPPAAPVGRVDGSAVEIVTTRVVAGVVLFMGKGAAVLVTVELEDLVELEGPVELKLLVSLGRCQYSM
jgi:hypothetical protein